MKTHSLALAVATALLSQLASPVAEAKPLAQMLTEDGSGYVQYRNYYWDERYRENSNYHGKDVKEWTQALKLSYSSGYLWDLIGFDMAAVGVFDVGNVSEDPSADYRPAGNRANNGDSQRSNIQTAYLKGQLPLGSSALKWGYGKKFRHSFTYQGQGNRIALSSSSGFDLSLQLGSHQLYGTVVTKEQRNNELTFLSDMVNHDGEQIDYVAYTGAKGRFGDLGYGIEFNQSDDYLQRFFAKANYRVSALNTTFETRVRQERENGDKFEFADHQSGFVNLIAFTDVGKTKITSAYQQVFSGDLFNSNAANGYNSCTNSIMFEWELPGLEGEQTALIKLQRPLDDLLWDGLKGEYTFMHSFDADHVTQFKRTENNFRLVQDLGALSSALKGASISWYQVWVRADGVDDGHRDGRHSELGTLYSGDITRINFNYRFSI